MYRDAPSWNEEYIIKQPDGPRAKAGVWAGGQCWLICSRKAIDLASRPQNVPRVKELFSPTLYFSDTIFAAGLYDCFDPRHPTDPVDDLQAKQKLCDYLRGEFGLFGSEEGREWGVAHADYFEGLMSHRTHFQRRSDTDIIIPLFELVYGDAIPLYTHQSDRPHPTIPNTSSTTSSTPRCRSTGSGITTTGPHPGPKPARAEPSPTDCCSRTVRAGSDRWIHQEHLRGAQPAPPSDVPHAHDGPPFPECGPLGGEHPVR